MTGGGEIEWLMITRDQVRHITKSIEAFNDLARNEIVRVAYHFKEAERSIARLNKLVEILHDEELIPADSIEKKEKES